MTCIPYEWIWTTRTGWYGREDVDYIFIASVDLNGKKGCNNCK